MPGTDANKEGAFRVSDRVIVAYLALEAGLVLLARPRLPGWWAYLGIHGLMIAGVLLLVRQARHGRGRVLPLVRDFYPALYIPLVFKQLAALVPAVNPGNYDALLLSWDEAVFGRYAGRFFDGIASPFLTELLRACWLSYFLLPFLVAVPLRRRKDHAPFHETVSVLVAGWLLSFLGYYLVPALGPGYFPDRIPAPACVDHAGPTGRAALALFALEGTMRDIFPSGHTLIALLSLHQAKRHGLRFWPLLVPVTAGLLAGTVYLRYHYGVDVLAGGLLAAVVVLPLHLAPPRAERRIPS